MISTRRGLFLLVLLTMHTNLATGRPSDDATNNYCIGLAALKFNVPSDLLHAILLTEGGSDGLEVRNKNKSHDLGRAQINDVHLPTLAKYGVTKEMLKNDPCSNIGTMAWLLANHLADAGVLGVQNPDPEKFWTAVGNYHSKTKSLNRIYRLKVWENLMLVQHKGRVR